MMVVSMQELKESLDKAWSREQKRGMYESLKPCPFCGSEDLKIASGGDFVICYNCDSHGCSRRQGIDWNTRPFEPDEAEKDTLRKRIIDEWNRLRRNKVRMIVLTLLGIVIITAPMLFAWAKEISPEWLTSPILTDAADNGKSALGVSFSIGWLFSCVSFIWVGLSYELKPGE